MKIQSNEIHLWLAFDRQITDPYLLSRYHELLSQPERAQQRRFHFARHRHQYLVTRALVRSTLSLYAPQVDLRSWQFTTNRYGKPAVASPHMEQPLFFNVSHTEGLVMLAVAVQTEVGVDVECLSREGATLEIAENYFSAAEVRDLFRLPPAQRRARFFDLWTLKEAYIKACGMGLSIPLQDFSYSLSAAGHIGISFAPARQDEPRAWRFWQLAPSPTHKAAVAVKAARVDASYSLAMYRCVPLESTQPAACEILSSAGPADRVLVNGERGGFDGARSA